MHSSVTEYEPPPTENFCSHCLRVLYYYKLISFYFTWFKKIFSATVSGPQFVLFSSQDFATVQTNRKSIIYGMCHKLKNEETWIHNYTKASKMHYDKSWIGFCRQFYSRRIKTKPLTCQAHSCNRVFLFPLL